MLHFNEKERDKKKKAAFTVAWMKFLLNFQAQKTTQERIIVERFSSSAPSTTTPGVPLTNFNDGGGSDRGSYFMPKKITTSVFVYPKKSLPFLAYPKKSLSSFFATQKNLSVFFRDPKNPGVFHKPKKITCGQNFRPKKITRTPPH